MEIIKVVVTQHPGKRSVGRELGRAALCGVAQQSTSTVRVEKFIRR